MFNEEVGEIVEETLEIITDTELVELKECITEEINDMGKGEEDEQE